MPLPGEDEFTPEELAEIGEVAGAGGAGGRGGGGDGQAGRDGGRDRGDGQPPGSGAAGVGAGSRRESSSRAASFGAGMALDVMAACPELALSADAAAGDDDRYEGASDAELAGAGRVGPAGGAHGRAQAGRGRGADPAASRAGVRPGGAGTGACRVEEFTADELAHLLAESRGRAEDTLTIAARLHTLLPGTRAALRDGTITRGKAEIIAWATGLLDPAEARAAEALVLGRAGRLTPGALRAAIASAVMQVAPEKARRRREAAAKDARVQRWAEDSGNAALMGRELPPAEVLAADQRITAWARRLRAGRP